MRNLFYIFVFLISPSSNPVSVLFINMRLPNWKDRSGLDLGCFGGALGCLEILLGRILGAYWGLLGGGVYPSPYPSQNDLVEIARTTC